ncbi:MAG: nuclear transport factor 2 family protein [Solirubrobacterales bacterium]
MSQENVETMRRSYEAMNSALASGEDLLPLMEGIDPDIVVEMGVLEGTFHGREGFVQFIEGQAAVFDNLRCDPEEIIDAGESIVVPMRLTGKARNTGLPLDYRAIHVWTLRNGKAIRLRLYESRDKALEAAGLRE